MVTSINNTNCDWNIFWNAFKNMQGKLKGTRPNNQQFLHEFAKNLPVNSKENFTVQDWVYFIESALWTRQLFVHFLVFWPYGNLWLKVLLWSLTEKRQNWITINKRWKCGAGQEMSKSSWKFMKGDNTPLLQVLQGLKIAAISFRNPLFPPLITSVNSVPFQPLPTTVISAWRPSTHSPWHMI